MSAWQFADACTQNELFQESAGEYDNIYSKNIFASLFNNMVTTAFE